LTPVPQDMNHPEGNCLQAAVASVLDLRLDQVPDFAKDANKQWAQDLVAWANSKGYGVCRFSTGYPTPKLHGVWVVGIGHARRGGVLHDDNHAIVCFATTHGDTMELSYEHDPHPSGAFVENVDYCLFFVKQ
jgi:hypothetical protein